MEEETKNIFLSALPSSNVLSYYELNKDSIFMSMIVILIMILSICILKLIVYGYFFSRRQSCYPPSFFFGDWEGSKMFIYNNVHSKQPAVEGFEHAPPQNVDSSGNAREERGIFSSPIEKVISMSNFINEKFYAFLEEKLYFVR